MKKPNDFDTAEARVTFTPISLGGHVAIIKNAEETISSNGNPMLKIAFDFDKSDEQAGYFMDRYKNNDNEDKKWPWQAFMYIVSEDAQGNTTKNFKNFCNDIEASNPGFSIKWGENFGAQFNGKKIGVVFGEEEYINNNGDLAISIKFKWTCAVANAKNQKIPAIKKVAVQALPTTDKAEGFREIKDIDAEEIPF